MWVPTLDLRPYILTAMLCAYGGQVSVSIHDWDIISKNSELGSTLLSVDAETGPFAAWYRLNRGSGQVSPTCMRLVPPVHGTVLKLH